MYMEMLRYRCNAGNHEVHEPANTDAKRAANTAQRDLLAEQALHQGALFCVYHPIGGVHDELTTARLALGILLAVVDMPIFLEPRRATFRIRLFTPHGHLMNFDDQNR